MDITTELKCCAAKEMQTAIDSRIMVELLTEGQYKLEITFGKDRYHEIGRMEYWCAEHIGKGGWTFGSPKTWEGMGEKVWVIHSIFGNTTFAFKDPRHYILFVLRWS